MVCNEEFDRLDKHVKILGDRANAYRNATIDTAASRGKVNFPGDAT